MSDEAADGKKKKGGLLGLILGLVLAIGGGAGGFYATYTGMLGMPGGGGEEDGHGGRAGEKGHTVMPEPVALAEFMALDPIIVTIGRGDRVRHLQFGAQLEIEPGAEEQIAMLAPRAVDVLNTYLRAVDPSDIEDPAAMLRMRAQMLRRIQVVMGEGKVHDLLVGEFVLQ